MRPNEPFYLEFEKPIAAIEKELQTYHGLELADPTTENKAKIKELEKLLHAITEEIYAGLTPWQRVQVCRHANRPHTRDFIEACFPEFMELHGDRRYSDDSAIVGGVALWPDSKSPVMVIGQQKGRTTQERIKTHFGMAKPEGIRKAIRLMELANRLQMPIITLIDTPGAYPGIDAEERGQAQAIAESIEHMFSLSVPTLGVVLGEGGSGGALALAACDKILMMEYSYYSVISPESAAAILWNDSGLGEKAAEKLKIFPSDLMKFKLVDGVIPEPLGGAHRQWDEAFKIFNTTLTREFKKLTKTVESKRLKDRFAKYRKMGQGALAKTS